MCLVALCTIIGVGPGLGMALARRFGSEGMTLALVARAQERLDRYREELAELSIEAVTATADAGDDESLSEALGQLHSDHGDPRVLIYNAAKMNQKDLVDLTAQEVHQELQIGVEGALTAARQVLPAMRAKGEGTLLFTGGGAAAQPIPSVGLLSASKAALRMVALTLAEELKDSGVRVGTVTIYGAIQPGTHFDPDRIAERYWQLHSGEAREVESEYR